MTTRKTTIRLIALTLILSATRSFAGSPDVTPSAAAPGDELTLANFFTEGWNQPYALRSSLPDGAPDLPLFHAATNFLVRASRTDFAYTNTLQKTGLNNVTYLDEYLDYAVNQRFMLSVFGNYTWLNSKTGMDMDGSGGGAIARFELVDTHTSSDCLNLRIDVPNKDIGDHTTNLSAAIAGWQDLSQLGAGRVGLYYALQGDVYAGKAEPGFTRNDLAYDVTLAKTWTAGTASVAYLTTFAEFSGGTNLNGTQRSLTHLQVTPGVQFIVGKHNLIMAGMDVPLTHPSGEREVYRLTYIYVF